MNQCPICDAEKIIEINKFGPVEYRRTSTSPVESVNVEVPVFHCTNCGYEYTDWRAEYKRQHIINSILQG